MHTCLVKTPGNHIATGSNSFLALSRTTSDIHLDYVLELRCHYKVKVLYFD